MSIINADFQSDHSNESYEWLNPRLRGSFVPLPSDPQVKLTPTQLKTVFGGDRRAVTRDILQLTGVPVERGESYREAA
jgi:hypothetical protein